MTEQHRVPMTEPERRRDSDPTRRTARLLLRTWREDDLDALARITDDEEVMRYIYGHPLSREEAAETIERFRGRWERRGFGMWAIERLDEPGLIGWGGLQHAEWLDPDDPPEEVGWMLAREAWGHGYATEVGAEGLRFGFEEHGLALIKAYHHPDNARSEHVMVKLGMRPAGETTSPRDGAPVRIREITRAEWEAREPVGA